MSIEEALSILEVENKSIIFEMKSANNHKEAITALEKLHTLVKKQRKVLAKKYHPDIGGDVEKFKQINSVCDKLLDMKVQVIQPQPVFHKVVIIRTGYDTRTTTYTTTW
jgi:hypothetical protein